MIKSIVMAATATVCLLAVSVASAEDNDAPSLDDIPHITIVGTAQIQVRPDLATIALGVITERPSATAAAAETARKAQALIDAAKAAGVPEIDIATQTVTLTQTFDPILDKNGSQIGRKPRGFSAENIVAIKLRDLAKAGATAEDLIGKGANRFDGVEFSVEHPQPILDNLIGAAVKNSRTQAQVAAEAANVRLGRVLVIERPGEGDDRRPYLRRKVAMAAAPAPAMPLEAGTSSFTTSVSVTWAIEPR